MGVILRRPAKIGLNALFFSICGVAAASACGAYRLIQSAQHKAMERGIDGWAQQLW